MESNSKKSQGMRAVRFLGRAVPAVLFAGVLAACGGGGGGGGGGGQPPPQPCDSQTSRGDGFALGSCAATSTNVFQPILADVTVNGVDAYTLTLDFPAELSSLDDVVPFTSANRPSDALTRNIIGVLEGHAFEENQGVPPYVAIVDFFEAFNLASGRIQLPTLNFVSFGMWEKFPGADFNEGYFGVWFAERPAASTVVGNEPDSATFTGRVIGIVGPGPSEPKALNGRFGFSASIALEVAGGRIIRAELGELTGSSQPEGGPREEFHLAVHPVVFSDSTVPPAMTGTVTSEIGIHPGDASISTGVYEARYFGIAGDHGKEIAGRFRFTTTSGLVGVASFAAIRP